MAEFTTIPAEWGPRLNTRSYDFYLGGNTPVSRGILLDNHGMEAPANDNIDEVTEDYEVRQRGTYVIKRRVIRQQQTVRATFNINVPNVIMSPVLDAARKNAKGGVICYKRLYGILNCPTDSKFLHAVVWDNTIFRSPVRAAAFRTIEDAAKVAWTVESVGDLEDVIFSVGLFEMAELAEPMYAVEYFSDDCPACVGDAPFSAALAVGGDGGVSDPVVVRRTFDRFATTTSLTTDAATNGHVGTSAYIEGSIALVGYSDDPDVGGAATTGGVLFWSDIDADTPAAPSVDVGITEPIFGIARFNGVFIAVGGTTAGAAVVYTSDDGVNWTAVVSGALPATHAATSIAVDKDNECLYVTCENGILLKGYVSANSLTFTDISSLLVSPGTNALFVVRVFAPGHIAVGGAAGFYNEMFPGDTEFTAVAVPGTDAVYAVAGTKYRAITAAGETLYVRDMLNNNLYTAKTVEDGASFGSAVVRGIAMPPGAYEHNYALVVLDDGTVGSFRPYFPGA